MLFGKSVNVRFAQGVQIIDSRRLPLLPAPKVRKNRFKCSVTSAKRTTTSRLTSFLLAGFQNRETVFFKRNAVIRQDEG
jgi:hypothetical protein